MQAATELPGIGRATSCQVSASHSPQPLRYVYHHIQPKEAGGPTTPENTVPCCDSCHYSIHRLLWHLAKGLPTGPVPRRAQLTLAKRGYAACVAAGTVAQIA